MTTADISPDHAATQISALLAVAESRTLEFKRISDKHARLIETICAFANAEGGRVVIGIGDAKHSRPGAKPESRLFGTEENQEAFDDFCKLVRQRFAPPLDGLSWELLPCTLHDGQPGHIAVLQVVKSSQVHSIVGGGTWTRGTASNVQLSASEIADLSYRRGMRSAADDLLPVNLALLDTPIWRTFLAARRLKAGSIADQLKSIGLAGTNSITGSDELQPKRAAVLLFADEPGSLLAAHGSRADIRLMVYGGKTVTTGALPNMRKVPLTIRGPLIVQIDNAVKAVLRELEEGITLASSGFKAAHVYPERVVKEAIVNAVVHRDYRLNRDIFIRIFDDRIDRKSVV